MRAVVIEPIFRTISEIDIPMSAKFMAEVGSLIGTPGSLTLDVAPPSTAMFLDAMGFLREDQGFWRLVGGKSENNVAGTAIMFGLDAKGMLADLPPEITAKSLADKIVWVDDKIASFVERMEIVEYPGGLAPRVNRAAVWAPGDEHPANSGDAPLAEVYAALPAPPAEVYKMHVTEPGAAPVVQPVWAIHETADNRYRVIEYEVTDAGLGAPLSLATVANLDAARERVPKGLVHRPADEDAADDTLVETWS